MADAEKIIELAVAAHREAGGVDHLLGDGGIAAGEERMALAAIKIVRLVVIGTVDDAVDLLGQGAEHDVPVAVSEALLEFGRRAENKVHEDIKVGLHQARNDFLHAEVRTGEDALRRADLQPPGDAAAHGGNAALEIVDVDEELAGRIIGRLAHVGEAELVPPAQAKLGAHTLFQLGEMGAEGGLREVQGDLRLGKAVGIHQHHEDAQQPEIDVVEAAHGGDSRFLH